MPEYVIEMRDDRNGDNGWTLLDVGITYHCSVSAYARAQKLARDHMGTRGISLDAMMQHIRVRDISGALGDLPAHACADFKPRDAQHPEFMHKMDWKLLRKQKATLARLAASDDRNLNEQEIDHLEGLLNGLDAIQDYAVDVMGLSDEAVFGPRDKDGYHIPEE